MGLFDFDFSAVERILATMSDEEKKQMMDTAAQMMGKMDTDAMAATAQEIREENEDEQSLEEALGIDEELLSRLDSTTLEQLESAVDLEGYYEDVDDADQSGAALFYAKAVLTMLRKHVAPLLTDVNPAFALAQMTTLPQYAQALSTPEGQAALKAKLEDPEQFDALCSQLGQVLVFLQRAEFDRISVNELSLLKDVLFEQGLISTFSAL
ncbi:hypothetical protein [Allobaculum mucilyticum]|uniref:hypothetical protein n=1 Tax=Allobaculum mucilyticum TaxID=2834459 RepID=UPI001E2A3355|nr:hypothetical protein [Allobaculum mucilyticum]UNT97010.1 hypothetical protein KWG62_04480 [Allobaculum mucilyticum]